MSGAATLFGRLAAAGAAWPAPARHEFGLQLAAEARQMGFAGA
ncbi:MAG: hypothetical protein ACREE1_09550 [Stellaceae bacterium]